MIKSLILLLLFSPQNKNISFDTNKYTVFTYDEYFIIITNDNIFKSNDGENWITSSQNTILNDFQKIPVKIDDKTYLISNGLGTVYEFSTNQNSEFSIVRIDNSHDWNSNYYSALFSLGKKIFSFGGYGYFSYKKEILCFDFKSREWNLHSKNNRNFLVERTKPIHQIVKSNDNNYLLVGLGINKYLNKTKILDDIWEYNFNEDSWSLKGRLIDSNILDGVPSSGLISRNKLTPIKFKYYKNSTFHDASLLFTEDKIIGFDLKNNIKINFPEIDYNITNNVDNIIYNEITDRFLLIKTTKLGYVETFFLEREEFLGKPVFSLLYDNKTNQLNYVYLTISLIILFIIVVIIYNKYKKISLKKFKEYTHRIKEELSDEEIQIFDLLIKKYPENISFPYILNFYEQNLSYESRIKKLRLSLSNIDYIIKTSSKNKIELEYSRSKNDKRIKECKLNFK